MQCIRRSLLLQMSHVVWSLCLSVFRVALMYSAEMVELIKMSFRNSPMSGLVG